MHYKLFHNPKKHLNVCRLLLCYLFVAGPAFASDKQQVLKVGAEQAQAYLPYLQGKRVGLVVNQTSQIKDTHLVDFLLAQNIMVNVLFAPEHGVRGDKGAGEFVDSGKDSKTQIPIQSIYGKNKTPPDEIMRTLDVIVFDIQDVGTRFYTYISSMHYMMQASVKNNLSFIVLDRPNPNGAYVDGPILEPEFTSFVGMHPIPVLHGLTVGELALMIKGEQWFEGAKDLDLKVIPVKGYNKQMQYSLPVAPSPNLPNNQSIALYPSLCFFEATAVSIGRGTDFPFQVIGHDKVKLGSFSFTPESRPNAAPYPKLQDITLFGEDLRAAEITGLDLRLFYQTFQQFEKSNIEFFTASDFMDKLAGTDKLRKAMLAGEPLENIRASWQAGLAQYIVKRKPYLLYPEKG
jgi:uncharacterized protein YbbC (DUF1343 family)